MQSELKSVCRHYNLVTIKNLFTDLKSLIARQPVHLNKINIYRSLFNSVSFLFANAFKWLCRYQKTNHKWDSVFMILKSKQMKHLLIIDPHSCTEKCCGWDNLIIWFFCLPILMMKVSWEYTQNTEWRGSPPKIHNQQNKQNSIQDCTLHSFP